MSKDDQQFYLDRHHLQAATVRASDLRAGAALVIAGLIADGETEVQEIQHIERGYSSLIEKLQGLGADIRKVIDSGRSNRERMNDATLDNDYDIISQSSKTYGCNRKTGGTQMERSLSMELVRVTEAAAVSAARWMGRGLKNEADDAATTAMRTVFDTIPMQGIVVIGEGEMDEAPMLYIGEELGTGQWS